MNWVRKASIFGTVTIASFAIVQSASARFVIFVAGNDPATLQKVRTIVPTAFPTKINDQPAIQAGTFNSETSADSLAISLQQAGLSAQKYFKSTGGKESNVQVPFTDSASSTTSATPQQVVIQQNSTAQPVSSQTDSQPQVFSSVPQQTIVYTNPQYQQIATSAVVPQVQTQQVLVPRWQQVLVPETRQVVTQSVVPQTQVVQSGYVQPQTGFIPTATQVAATTTSDATTTTNYALSPQTVTSYSNDAQLPQATQNPNFRYVAAIPAPVNNQFLLARVRQYVPNAFFTNSGRGTYIHAGAYQSRDAAESVSRYLRSQGVDSRVLYF